MPRAQCVKHLSVQRLPKARAVSHGKSATTAPRSQSRSLFLQCAARRGRRDFRGISWVLTGPRVNANDNSGGASNDPQSSPSPRLYRLPDRLPPDRTADAGRDGRDRIQRNARRERVVQSDCHAVRARRASVRGGAGRAPSRHQGRCLAADALPDGHRQLSRRTRPARRRLRSPVRHQSVRIRLLHGHQPEHSQSNQPVHGQRRRCRDWQPKNSARPQHPE